MEYQVGDNVRWLGAFEGRVDGRLYVVENYNGDAHVRFPGEIGMVVFPAVELMPGSDKQGGITRAPAT